MTKNELIAAAKELNETLGLEPGIAVDGSKQALETGIKEAATLVDPAKDVLSDATWKVLGEVADMQRPADSAGEGEGEGEGAGEASGEPEAPKAKTKTEKKDKPAPKAKTEKKDKPEKKDKAPRVTKKSIIEKMIGTKKGATIDEMAQAMVDEGIDSDLDKNKQVTKLWLAKMGFDVKKAAIEKNPHFKA